jgi:hypothetical protein
MSESRTDNTFTFANGRTVSITRVSPLTLQSVERSVPRPQPPMQPTDLGPEPNYAHPDYVRAVGEWTAKINEVSLDTMLLFGVEADIDEEALEKARAKARRAGIALPDDDHLCYLKHVCIGSLEELTRLRAAILDTSLPTEEKIADAGDSFKSDVEGQADPQG